VKECQTCHVRGHYSITCPQNPNRSKAAENKAKKRGAKAEGWVQRKRDRPRVKNGQNGDQEGQSEADETQQSECSVVVQQSQALAQLLESEERPRAMLTTRMTMNLNESNIIYPIASIWFAKKLLDKNTI
jgi:hypothetical protein